MAEAQQLPNQSGHQATGNLTVAAWDLPTRIFHWLLVGLVAFSWASMEYAEELRDPLLKWHRWSGLLILTVLVWRLLWGIFGSSTSRFKNFVPYPKDVTTYVKAMMDGTEPKYLGHNPLGSLMVLALIATLFTQASLGLFAVEHNDLTAGPLYRFLSEEGRKTATSLHHMLFNLGLFWLISAHIAANVFYAIIRREPLIKAMFTGRKPAAHYADSTDGATISGRPLIRAALLLGLSAFIVFGGIWAVGGKFLQMQMRFW